jgi:O-antigen/teichoic acid export membrane protein
MSPFKDKYLNKIQSILRTDIRYLLRGGFYLSIGQTFAALSSFILTVFLVRILDQSEYGQYSYIISLAGVIAIFSHSGMDTAVAQAVAKGYQRSVMDGFWAKLKWCIPVSVITLGVSLYYLYRDNEILGFSILIIALTTPLLATSSLYGAYFNGKKEFKKLAYDNVFRNATISISILIVAYLTHNITYIVLAFFLSNTLISVARFANLLMKIPKSDNQMAQSTLSFGKHMSVMELLGNVTSYVDKIVIFQFLGATHLAFYSLALAPIKQLSSVARVTRTLVLPKFSTRSAHELKKLMHHKILIFFLILLVVTVAYCFFAQLFFHVIFPEYEEALLYSQVLSLGLLFMPSVLYLEALSALKRKRELYIVNITKSLTRIALMAVLIPLYGVWGAILTFIFTQVFLSIQLYVLFNRIKTVEDTNVKS